MKRSMTAVAALAVACAVLGISGCSRDTSDASCNGFAISLVVTSGGQPTPTAAARWFAAHGKTDVTLPRTGWRQTSSAADGTIVGSGGSSLHALRADDGMWLVDSGQVC